MFVGLDKPDFLGKAYLEEGDWEIDIAGEPYSLRLGLANRAMYDSKMEKVRADRVY